MYAQAEYATENLDFVRCVEQFEQSGDLAFAEQIYKEFISTAAARQVNIIWMMPCWSSDVSTSGRGRSQQARSSRKNAAIRVPSASASCAVGTSISVSSESRGVLRYLICIDTNRTCAPGRIDRPHKAPEGL
jgi:hypothetical protein